jgi:hypothetical protein
MLGGVGPSQRPERADPEETDMRRLIPGVSRRTVGVAASLGAASLAWLLGPTLWQAPTPAQTPRQDAGKPETIQSIRPRLAYELKADRAAPKLTGESRTYLEHVEFMLRNDYRAVGNLLRRPAKQRAAAFQNLHEESVKHFVNAEGFGMERMIAFIPKYLEVPEAPPIKLARTESFSESEAGDPVKLPPDAKGANPLRLPALDGLTGFHADSERSFVNLPGFAFVSRDGRDRKAPLQFGFRPHQFRHVPDVTGSPLSRFGFGRPVGEKPAKSAAKEKWLVQRIELVSLLKHKEPVAYVSAHLPRMDELRKAPTRPLDGFEMTGLKSLRDGETLVSDASVNRIYLLGAVRAATMCLDCHQVPRGTLLGAFSYELWRTPPITEEKGG